MELRYKQLMLSELRVFPIKSGDNELSDENMLKAMTVNEELSAFGYILSPRDVIKLAKSEGMDTFLDDFKACIGEVKAEPMYPGFPAQVMKMDEAVFRFHQMLHYFSTYGAEYFTGEDIHKGWLPSSEADITERSEKDRALLERQVVELVSEDDKYIIPYTHIMSKTERMTDKEKRLVTEAIKNIDFDVVDAVSVRFKENLFNIFEYIFLSDELTSEDKLYMLHSICQHTGDVWKCVAPILAKNHYHFKTSQKRLLVKILESYPIADFKANLILSNKKSGKTIKLLQFIDYNEYSRKDEYKKAVYDLRSGALRSWESRAKYLVESHSEEALDYYASRPGIMLRSLTYLLRNGYAPDDISRVLGEKAGALSPHTLVSLINYFARPDFCWISRPKSVEAGIVKDIVSSLLFKRLQCNDSCLKGKKVFVDMNEYDLTHSSLCLNDASVEGGYIRSGIAVKIPEEVRRIRMFVYWNDEERVDVDLHTKLFNLDGNISHIGWNGEFKNEMACFSGDITHSDAAEYIDIDLDKAKDVIDVVSLVIDLYYGKPSFGEIDECFVGCMAVNKIGEDVELYDPKNCFFNHYLTSKTTFMDYGYIDVQNRVITFIGKDGHFRFERGTGTESGFSMSEYLDILLKAQSAQVVSSVEEADIVLVMGKPSKDSEISFIDNNYFLEDR